MAKKTPRRRKFVFPVHPETKDRITRCAEFFKNQSVSSLLANVAAAAEKSVLARLPTDEMRQKYLRGKLTHEQAFGKPLWSGNARRPLQISAIKEFWGRKERVALSMEMPAEAGDQLQRYCDFIDVTMAFYVDHHSRTIERHILARLKTDEEKQRFLAGEWRRELPPDLGADPLANGNGDST
jgi:hypothetical protein